MNPNDTALADSGIFGLDFTPEQARLHLIPVPWEATTSYGNGTANGPAAIERASHQVDLFDIETGTQYEKGIFMPKISEHWLKTSRETKTRAEQVVARLEAGREADSKDLEWVNTKSRELNTWVYDESRNRLSQNKIVGVVGGDHSSPFGLIKALSEKYSGQFGILHIDAHADLRDAYQGFEFSHASIMHNVVMKLDIQKLVQVGIRDFSQGEYQFIQENPKVIKTYFDTPLKQRLFAGENWRSLCREIVSHLPDKVYVSFDIDGLSPEFCPHTGTPVPGGLSFDQALMLISTLAEAQKKIIGFDVNEVAVPDALLEDTSSAAEWDANVGARLLFKLCNWALK